MAGLADAVGAVTAITGFEKGSGKTTFLNHALPVLRAAGPVALFTIGLDGTPKGGAGSEPAPAIRVEPGDVVMTTDAFARTASASLEILEALPGRSTLGRPLLGRVRRGGTVTLVGSEHLSVLAEAIALVRREGWAKSVLVDGAVNRLTQVAALGELGFIFTARIDPGNLARVAARLRHLGRLAALPVEPEPATGTWRLDGPLGPAQLAGLPEGCPRLSLEDFTKVFLEPVDFARTLERMAISVRRGFRLRGLAVTLRDLSRAEFLQVLGEPLQDLVLFNPYEVAS